MSEDKPPATGKPGPPAGELRRRREERLAALRLRVLIDRALEERGLAEPAAVGEALGMPAAEPARLLRRHRWREGDAARLAAAAARLGLRHGDGPA